MTARCLADFRRTAAVPLSILLGLILAAGIPTIGRAALVVPAQAASGSSATAVDPPVPVEGAGFASLGERFPRIRKYVGRIFCKFPISHENTKTRNNLLALRDFVSSWP